MFKKIFADFIVKFEQILRVLLVLHILFKKVAGWKKHLMSRKQNTTSSPINPFYFTVPFLYPVKTSANQKFSDVFREYRERTVAKN